LEFLEVLDKLTLAGIPVGFRVGLLTADALWGKHGVQGLNEAGDGWGKSLHFRLSSYKAKIPPASGADRG
jgi:hypothetical protein